MNAPSDLLASAAEEGSRVPSIWRILSRQMPLVLLGLVVGVGLALPLALRKPPIYKSEARILVLKKQGEQAALPSGEQPSYLSEDFLATHKEIIRSPVVVGKAVEIGKLNELPSLAASESPRDDIIDGLKVTQVGRDAGSPTSVLLLSYVCEQPADSAPILNAVLESYKAYLDSKYAKGSKEFVEWMSKARDVLDNQLAKSTKEYKEFCDANGLVLRGKDGLTVGHERLMALEIKRSTARLRKVELELRVTEFEKAVKEGRSRAELLVMAAESLTKLTRDPGVGNDDPIAPLLLQEQVMVNEFGFGQDHPQLQALRKRIDAQRGLSRLEKPREIVPSSQDPVEAHLQFLKREVESAKISEQALTRLLQVEQAEAQKTASREFQDENFREQIARHKELLKTIAKRLDEVSVLKDTGGWDATCIAEPAPGTKIGPSRFPPLALGCIFGLLGGLGLGFLAEFLNQSFRSTTEVHDLLRLPIIGQIPQFPKETTVPTLRGPRVLHPTLFVHYQPKSNLAECFRGVRTNLLFSTMSRTHKVIQVTSPNTGDGKSTLAANLAISVAQSEKRVLLVDADLRRPNAHVLFSVANKEGLSSILLERAQLADVVQPTGIAGLSVLPCGPIPANPSELFTLPRFQALLEELRQQYEYVIIDSPPLLAVTDPCIVAPHMDGVILSIRLARNARPAALRAKSILATLGAKVIGVVVTGGDNPDAYGNESYYTEQVDAKTA